MGKRNNKENKNNPEANSDSVATPSTTETPPKKKTNLVKILGWCVFLSALCMGSFILYEHLITKDDNFPIGTTDTQLPKKPTLMAIRPESSDSREESSPSVDDLSLEENDNEPMESEEEEEEEQVFQEEIFEENEPSGEPAVEINEPDSQIQIQSVLPKSDYTLEKALTLRDAVQQNHNCRELLEDLMQAQYKTHLMEKVIVSLLPQCSTDSISDDLLSLFQKDRKRAIISIFQQKYPSYKAHLYALPWLLIEIHQINPTGSTPMNTLDKLYYALRRNDTEAALMHLSTLPPQTAAIFNGLNSALMRQKERVQLLNQLILSFAEKGE